MNISQTGQIDLFSDELLIKELYKYIEMVFGTYTADIYLFLRTSTPKKKSRKLYNMGPLK